MTSQQAAAAAELCRTLLIAGSLSHLKEHANAIYTDSTRWAKWWKKFDLSCHFFQCKDRPIVSV